MIVCRRLAARLTLASNADSIVYAQQHRNVHTTCSSLLRRQHTVPRVVANRREEQFAINDYGYYQNYHQRGDKLPRLRSSPRQPLPPVQGLEVAEYDDTDPRWTKENALFGQNDYIDLLGDGSVHPAQLMYHQPPWLRGFPGDHRAHELIRLLHYRNIYKRQLQANAPKRWADVNKRIKYLLKYHNYRKQDELHPERDLGLWPERPDFFYKENLRRSYDDGTPHSIV